MRDKYKDKTPYQYHKVTTLCMVLNIVSRGTLDLQCIPGVLCPSTALDSGSHWRMDEAGVQLVSELQGIGIEMFCRCSEL